MIRLVIACLLWAFAAIADDPFDPHALVPSGPLKGKALDTSSRRAIRRIGPTSITNVFHQGKFWTAYYEPSAVSDVIFQVEHWGRGVPAAHTQLRFRFDLPVILISQSNESEVVAVDDLIVTAEATYAQGEPATFNMLKGLRGYYGITVRVVSLENVLSYMRNERGHNVKQLRLDLDREKMRLLFENALKLSEEWGHGQMYHTWKRSCTTVSFDLIDTVTELNYQRSWAYFFDQLPIFSGPYLMFRGLLKEKGSRLPDLQEEVFGDKAYSCTERIASEALL